MKFEIPVAIDSLSAEVEICIGEIPDLRSAKEIRYSVAAQSGGSLAVGIRKKEESGIGKTWYQYVSRGDGKIDWKKMIPSHTIKSIPALTVCIFMENTEPAWG